MKKGGGTSISSNNLVSVSMTAKESCYAVVLGSAFGNGGTVTIDVSGINSDPVIRFPNHSLQYGHSVVEIYKVEKDTIITCTAQNGTASAGMAYTNAAIALCKP